MKTKRKLLFITILCLFLVGCSKKIELSFEGKTLTGALIKIHELKDGRTIYSEFPENYYLENNQKIELSDAFRNNKVTIDDITKKMKFYSALNDGGSIIYRYSNKRNGLANKEFYLVFCDSLEGNGGVKDIFIGEDMNIGHNCIRLGNSLN